MIQQRRDHRVEQVRRRSQTYASVGASPGCNRAATAAAATATADGDGIDISIVGVALFDGLSAAPVFDPSAALGVC